MDTTEGSLTSDHAEEPGAPRVVSRSTRRWTVALVVVSLVLGGLGVIARYVRLPYDTLAPGSARAVNSVIEVKGHP